jgi:hypothetical protein
MYGKILGYGRRCSTKISDFGKQSTFEVMNMWSMVHNTPMLLYFNFDLLRLIIKLYISVLSKGTLLCLYLFSIVIQSDLSYTISEPKKMLMTLNN